MTKREEEGRAAQADAGDARVLAGPRRRPSSSAVTLHLFANQKILSHTCTRTRTRNKMVSPERRNRKKVDIKAQKDGRWQSQAV